MATTLFAVPAAAQEYALTRVEICPGPMDQKAGKGEVDVTIHLPADGIGAGKPLLSMPIVLANTESAARTMTGLAARDAKGAVSLIASDEPEAILFSRHWTASHPIVGDLIVSYRAPIDNMPPRLGAGPPVMLRIDGDGFSAAGNMFLMTPETGRSYRIAIDWNVARMGAGATATSSYSEGDVTLPAGAEGRLGTSIFMVGGLKREPGAVKDGGFSSAWLGTPPFDPAPLMQRTRKLHCWMSGFFKDDAEPP